jgi:magnesium-transporting ATPase (P-type)
VALPLVLSVTMAIGAANMASKHHAIVTRTSALQDIASMEILCSDKTGKRFDISAILLLKSKI